MTLSRATLKSQILRFIERGQCRENPSARDRLLTELARYQAQNVPVYKKLCAQLGVDLQSNNPGDFPGLPTDIFRFAHVANFKKQAAVKSFLSSGTTASHRSQHSFRDLSLTLSAARAAARYALFPDRKRLALIHLVGSEKENPRSSLSFMLARFNAWFGEGKPVYVWKKNRLDLTLLDHTLREAERTGRKVALLGTSFAFMHAEEGLGKNFYRLPLGGRLMHTGGFKGKSATLTEPSFLARLAHRYGIDASMIIAEYGMTELSSQGYQLNLREALLSHRRLRSRSYWFPPWVRASIVGKVTRGCLRLDDLANLDSACMLLTADVARQNAQGIELLGRARHAVPRGCSLDARLKILSRPR